MDFLVAQVGIVQVSQVEDNMPNLLAITFFIIYITCILMGCLISGDKEALKGIRGLGLIILLIVNNVCVIYFMSHLEILK